MWARKLSAWGETTLRRGTEGGLTQICVEEGTDSASREQGPLKVGSQQLAVSLKPWMGPIWGGSSQEACTEVALSTLVEKPRAAGAAEEMG